jgi:hypothetical protein
VLKTAHCLDLRFLYWPRTLVARQVITKPESAPGNNQQSIRVIRAEVDNSMGAKDVGLKKSCRAKLLGKVWKQIGRHLLVQSAQHALQN